MVACFTTATESDEEETKLVVFTVATDRTDGFTRFMDSADKYGYKVKVLGMGEKWKGGDVARYPGGGHKVSLFKAALEEYKDAKDTVVMFVDSYDVVFSAGPKEVLNAFKKFEAKVVFSAEDFCWPDQSLTDKYPVVKPNEKRYLNSGGFIGRAPAIYQIVTHTFIGHQDDDQLYYTKIFLKESLRENLKIRLDTKGEIFQNLNGALDEVRLKFKGSQSYMYNLKTGNTPIVIHGNGPIKVEFNNLANYLADQWTPLHGCQNCDKGTISLSGLQEDDFPRVMIGMFLEHPTAFAEEYFQNIAELVYPKSKIDLYIHYTEEFHARHVMDFMDLYGTHYNSVRVQKPDSDLNSWTARNKALEECIAADCQYYFNVDGDVQIENPKTLQLLIERNRSVIAPLMIRPGKMWSNFWGALSSEGFYKRSDDYVEIIQNRRRGIWNVPYMAEVYLIQASRLPSLVDGFISGDMDPDMAICKSLRDRGVFMYIDNQVYYGHLVNSEFYNTTRLHNDLWMLFDNKYTWEKKYLHPNYTMALAPEFVNEQPCNDVYWFPIYSTKFCDHLVQDAEFFGKWSGGGEAPAMDERLGGGYENVPTVDIHMNQLGYEREWLHLLREYVAPYNLKVFTGYYTDSRAIMNFIVRYRPNEQNHLRPHHDSSTFTINVALNTPGLDYQGGGTRFIRQNCTLLEHRKGWMLMHPGRLTHYHEGLRVTGGTRYIMVSFIDP
eukprot:GHVU01075451.1.p1 GENE.GHVU01075451.1~~GHVU01075451.1.p1  ORF type:complete len:720 (+),score=75.26 GHVU01075451.1:2-2161(+)